jgi:hypothetical protein
MPAETGRLINRKRVKLPSGATVDVPVISQIKFLDVVSQGQETEFHLDNTSAAKRDVHVASVPGSGQPLDESGASDGLKVERIDVWRVSDLISSAQESDFHLDNKTVNASAPPPYFKTHEKTHVVKYINEPDDGNWIKSELIDSCKFSDTVEQSQETEYFLANPPDNAAITGLMLGADADGTPTIAVDPSVAEITDAIDPLRTDPFQNIVDYSGGYLLVFTFEWTDMVIDSNWQVPNSPTTIVPSTTTITLDAAPSGASLLWSDVDITSTTSSGGVVNTYAQTIVYDIAALPSADNSDLPMAFAGSITDQATYAGYTVSHNPGTPPFSDITYVSAGPQQNALNGPWPIPSFALYSKAKYHFEISTGGDGAVIPNDPADHPGPIAGVSLGKQLYKITTVASTDTTYYPGGLNPPNTIISGGLYSTLGLFAAGRFGINLQQLRSPDGSANLAPQIWPTLPVIRTVDSVFPPNQSSSVINGDVYIMPNPPDPYNFGVYIANNVPYKFGGPPLTSNKYTGTVPTYP